MAPARARKEKPAAGPDDLVRESAGTYRSGDGRFEVRKADVGWYIIDTQQANEFGQQLIHGPLSTLGAVRDAIPGTRDLKPLLRALPSKATAAGTTGTKAKQPPAPPRQPPPSWIDQLRDKERAEVKRLIEALEREGLTDAEDLVRHHRDDAAPSITTRVIEHRLRSLIADVPEDERARARSLVNQVAEILSTDGLAMARPMSRWAVIEIAPDEPAPRRRIRPEL
jgi:hypothetical protein